MAKTLTQPLILASASPGRRQLLSEAGYQFEVSPSHVDEPSPANVTDPRAYVQHVAWLKAAAVAPRYAQGIILAADSIAWHDGKVIGKPEDEADARAILTKLGGSQHELWTGVCLWLAPSNRQICWQEASVVFMQPWSHQQLESYLASGAWEGKSGAYGIQIDGDPFVSVLKGSFSNVIGLPLESFALALNWLGERS